MKRRLLHKVLFFVAICILIISFSCSRSLAEVVQFNPSLKTNKMTISGSSRMIEKLPASVGPDDSVIIVSGKIDMNGFDYYAVFVGMRNMHGNPNCEPGVVCDTWNNFKIENPEAGLGCDPKMAIHGCSPTYWAYAPKECKIVLDYAPQFKGKESLGYKTYIIFKNTAKNTYCFRFFSGLLDISGLYPFVIRHQGDKIAEEWDIYGPRKITEGHKLGPVRKK